MIVTSIAQPAVLDPAIEEFQEASIQRVLTLWMETIVPKAALTTSCNPTPRESAVASYIAKNNTALLNRILPLLQKDHPHNIIRVLDYITPRFVDGIYYQAELHRFYEKQK